MIKYEDANYTLDAIIKILNSEDALNRLILETAGNITINQLEIIDYMAAKRLFEHLEDKTHIEFYKHFAAQIIEKYRTRGVEYVHSIEHYYDIHMLEEACRYKIKFVKLSQKTSQIKNRRKYK